MNYQGLTSHYWRQQRQRVEALRVSIGARSSVQPGRVVPDDDDIAIGTGRRPTLAVLFLASQYFPCAVRLRKENNRRISESSICSSPKWLKDCKRLRRNR